jgi:4,5-dihydroxyphthalate decarboxylase
VANGDDRWVGLPVFTTHYFFHTRVLVRRDAGIDAPADLKGKRVGVPEYQQTAALWTRGILQHEFGVAPSDMEYWMERPPSHSHLGAVGVEPPRGVTIHQIPPDKNIGTMMASGELDATLHYLSGSNLVDRSRIDLLSHPQVKRLFADPVAEGTRYYRKTGLFPINHGMVIRREIAQKHPWVLLNLYKAFEQANLLADEQRREHTEYHVATGAIDPQAGAGLLKPVLQHGIAANRAVLETLAQYSFEQGLTPRLMKLEELFAASTMMQ